MSKSNLKSIEGLMDKYNPYKERLNETRKLVNKWEPTGLLEGISEESKVFGMACLLENQARQLIDESSKTSTQSNSEEWSGVALPLVRRIFGELAAQDFVSVQPMNLPSGLIFYLDYKIGTTIYFSSVENYEFKVSFFIENFRDLFYPTLFGSVPIALVIWFVSFNTCLVKSLIQSLCSLDANSGTTPPNG